MKPHSHNWVPCHGWTGRYRCTECFALGYRGIINAGVLGSARDSAIIPYRCTRQGCGHPATRRNPQRCSGHK